MDRNPQSSTIKWYFIKIYMAKVTASKRFDYSKYYFSSSTLSKVDLGGYLQPNWLFLSINWSCLECYLNLYFEIYERLSSNDQFCHHFPLTSCVSLSIYFKPIHLRLRKLFEETFRRSKIVKSQLKLPGIAKNCLQIEA